MATHPLPNLSTLGQQPQRQVSPPGVASFGGFNVPQVQRQQSAPQSPANTNMTFAMLQRMGVARPAPAAPPTGALPRTPTNVPFQPGAIPRTPINRYAPGQEPVGIGGGIQRPPVGVAPTPSTGTPGVVPYTGPMMNSNAGFVWPQMGSEQGYRPRNLATNPVTWGEQTGVTGANSPVNTALQQQILAALTNPSAYNSDMVKESYDRLNTRLSEGYDTQRQQLGEEMARRGLWASTNYGGRLGDLGVQQGRAQADLAHSLLVDAARTYAQDRATAAQLGMQYQQLDLNALAQLLGLMGNAPLDPVTMGR